MFFLVQTVKLVFVLLPKSQSVKFLLIESVKKQITDSVKKYILLLNQLIITN